ncbi:MAG: heme ABC exporter ATP-binding protein CcmA [Pseudomonadota bacterium]
MDMSVRELVCARGGIPVIEGVSFDLRPGSALMVRGPNGSGKTTLLRTLTGLQPPVSGTIAPGPEVMAYAAHADGIKTTLSVAENLQFWAALHRSRSVFEAINAFALAALAERPAGALSAGQRRRLGLARLLVTGRPIWVLDEPTVSLDAEAVLRVTDVLRQHLEDGGSAIIATHLDIALPASILDLSAHRATAPEVPKSAFDEAVG